MNLLFVCFSLCFVPLFVAVLRLVCVPFVSHFGISISVATTHFLTGFGEQF